MKNSYTFFAFILFLAAGCTNPLREAVVGNWQAVKVTEERDTLPVNTEEITLSLRPDAGYEYSGTLNYEEAGNWHLEGDLLITADTLNDSAAKAVLILQAARDTLILEMQEEGKKRILTMTRN